MFNPYREWLGLPPELEKPNYFHILRIKADVTDPAAIAKAAQRATLKVRSAKPGDQMLEWTRLIAEIETARMVLSDPELRKPYIKQLIAEKKAREEAEANAAPAAAFEEIGDEEEEAGESGAYDEESAEEEAEEDDPMAAWSAAYGAKPAKATPAIGVKGKGPKSIGPKGIGPAGAAASEADSEGGPVKIRKAIKGRKKPGPVAYAVIGFVFLLAIGGAVFGGMYAFQMMNGGSVPGPGPDIAVRPTSNPNPNPNPNPDPAPGPETPAAADPATAAPMTPGNGGFGTTPEVAPDPAMSDPEMPEPAATDAATDPFTAGMPADDPELAAQAAEDDPFYVEPTLRRFGYEFDPNAAVAMVETTDDPAPMPSGRELTDDERVEIDSTLTEIREMLVRRQVPQAQQRIADLIAKFPETQVSEKLEAIQLLTQKFRQFWIAVVQGAQQTPTGVPLDYEGTMFSLVEASPQLIVVRVAGENKRWPPPALPGGLAFFFAEKQLNDGSAESEIVIGTIYALENGGAKADKARDYWQRAASMGEEETVQKLLPLLDASAWSAP